MYNVAVRRVALARINRRIGELTRTAGSALGMLEALRAVDERATDAIEMRYIDLYGEGQTAEELGCSVRTVHYWVQRGFDWLDDYGI